ncbi:hypothetical protein GWK47_022886 [Chionoecetes opilio]|uniref:Uncharacterized protein n=1 Tax=Chionoecetes opilio TaxID=41210 RepID=A0A8J5CDH6_CHIOP|nr:hypothetical protein GWK47_022886 [Chionoecetes opilio]
MVFLARAVKGAHPALPGGPQFSPLSLGFAPRPSLKPFPGKTPAGGSTSVREPCGSPPGLTPKKTRRCFNLSRKPTHPQRGAFPSWRNLFTARSSTAFGMTCLSKRGPRACRVGAGPRGGYVPGGDHQPGGENAETRAPGTLKKTRARLTQTIQYMSKLKGWYRRRRASCRQCRAGRVKPTDTDDWKYEQLYFAATAPDQPARLPPHTHTVRRVCNFIIEPNNLEKEIRLQLPIMMATYPYRNSDGTLKKRKAPSTQTSYPTSGPGSTISPFSRNPCTSASASPP